MNLIIWATVGLVAPAPILLAIRLLLVPSLFRFSLQSELLVKSVTAFFIALATWIVARREARPLDDYGLPLLQAFGWKFWEGSAWGFALLSTVLLILRASGHLRIDSLGLTAASALRYALGWAVVFLGVSVSEELSFRGYSLFVAARRARFWRAAVILSLVFAAVHLGNPGENAIGIFQVFEIGMFLCLTIRRTGNLWFAFGFHASWDWAQTFFYGTPDSGLLGNGRLLNTTAQGPEWLSGGAAGPEGSVIAIVVILLCALLIHLRFPNAAYPDRPV